MGTAFKYWAFISYSHADDAWGKWLHKALESYRVPRRLVGRPHADGAIPRRLFPVFRDRDELPSSSQLSAVINEALAASRHQIVICSPHAAASRWVNEEIKHFKSLGRSGRVFALIIDGEPNASEQPGAGQPECFPPALRFQVDAHGLLTDERSECVAADARGGKDGKRDALLKLVSGLLGVSFDELKQRERTRARWRLAGFAAIAGVVLLLLGGVWQWQEDRRDELGRQERIARYVEQGRKELDADHPARAAAYFADAYALGEDSAALRYLLAKAMRGIDPLVRSFRNDGGGGWLTAAFSPDGSRVVTGGASSPEARVWDAQTGEPLLKLDTGGWIGQVGYSPDGRVIHTASAHQILLWNAESGERIAAIAGTALGDATLRVLPAGDSAQFFTFGADGVLRSYDFHTGAPRLTLSPPASPDGSVALSRDGATVAAAQGAGIQLWNARTGRALGLLQGHAAAVTSLDFSPDGTQLASVGADGAVLLWDWTARRLVATLRRAGDEAWALFGNDPRRLMLTDRSGAAQWLDLPAHGGTAAVLPAGSWLSPDGRWTAWKTSGNRFHVLSAGSGARVLSLEGHAGEVVDTSFAPAGLGVMSISRDGTAKLWEPQPQERPVVRDGTQLLDARYVAAGETLLTLNARGETVERDSATGEVRRRSAGALRHAGRGALSATGDRALVAVDASRYQLLDTATGQPIAALEGHRGGTLALFSADGRRVVTVDVRLAQVWDAGSGAPLLKLEGGLDNPDLLQWAALSPDGARLAVAHRDGSIRLIDVDRREEVGALQASPGALAALDWSQEERTLVSLHGNGFIRVRDVAADRIQHEVALSQDCADAGLERSPFAPVAVITCGATPFLWHFKRRLILPLSGHSAVVLSVAFSPDGTRVATGAQDSTVRIWDVATGALLDTLAGHTWTVDGASFSADGRWLMTRSYDKTLRQWEMIAPEARSPAQIAQVMRCKSPWRLDGEQLVPQRADPMSCAAAPRLKTS